LKVLRLALEVRFRFPAAVVEASLETWHHFWADSRIYLLNPRQAVPVNVQRQETCFWTETRVHRSHIAGVEGAGSLVVMMDRLVPRRSDLCFEHGHAALLISEFADSRMTRSSMVAATRTQCSPQRRPHHRRLDPARISGTSRSSAGA
jgi:hypothetical protein